MLESSDFISFARKSENDKEFAFTFSSFLRGSVAVKQTKDHLRKDSHPGPSYSETQLAQYQVPMTIWVIIVTRRSASVNIYK